MPQRDYYQILGLARDVDPDALKKAYRQLARKWHPDVNKSKDAPERFAEIQGAYDVLSDPEKRKQYDRFGHVGVGAGAPGGGGHPFNWSSASGQPGAGFGGGSGGAGPDLGSIFEELFGGRGGRTSQQPRANPQHQHQRHQPPPKGEDLQHAITITFQTATHGGIEPLRLSSAASGNQSETIDITIPPGIENHTKLRIRGKGHPGPDPKRPGDLILTVNVGEHPYYQRQGLDIILDLPLTIAEAVLGTTITVPTLKGQVELKIPPGAQSNQRLRIPNHGITPKKGDPGHFLVILKVKTPTDLDPETTSLFESMQDQLASPRDAPPWI